MNIPVLLSNRSLFIIYKAESLKLTISFFSLFICSETICSTIFNVAIEARRTETTEKNESSKTKKNCRWITSLKMCELKIKYALSIYDYGLKTEQSMYISDKRNAVFRGLRVFSISQMTDEPICQTGSKLSHSLIEN